MTTNEKTSSLRNGLFCCLVFLGCYLLAWPVAQMGFLDDWSYIKIAQRFSLTGHILYTGWGTPMLGWMIPWGALFIKLFGFSYMVVKLSTLPLALTTLLLFHSVLRRFGITPRNAVIGTLTLGLSPLFLPLSASFMSDIPGLFVIVLCLYCCQRAVWARTEPAAIGWLVLAAMTNVVGGTARQIAWLGVLVMVPCTGWMLRKQRKIFIGAVLLWLFGIGAVLFCLHWFSLQRYAIQSSPFPKIPHSWLAGLGKTVLAVDQLVALVLCLLLLIFPVLSVWLPEFGKKMDRYLALLCAGVLPLMALKYLCGNRFIVWPTVVLDIEFVAQRSSPLGTPLSKLRYLIPDPARLLISFVLLAALFALMFKVEESKGNPVGANTGPLELRNIVWLLVPFFVSYFAFMVSAALQGFTRDRYMLDVMPFAIAACIWLYQRFVRPNLPAASVVLLVFYAVFAVAATHNLFSWQRARLKAIREVRTAGIPRTEIQGGYDYDGWTQIMAWGYVDNPAIKIPSSAYKVPHENEGLDSKLCQYAFRTGVPAIHPRYAVGFGPKMCYLPSRFPAVHYTAWLPPFRRTVEVERVPSGTE